MQTTWLYILLVAVLVLATAFAVLSLRGGSRLQRRLFILFFLLSFLPAATILLVNWRTIQRHLGILESPGLLTSLESSLDLARETLQRERDATRAAAMEIGTAVESALRSDDLGLPSPPHGTSYRFIDGERDTTLSSGGGSSVLPAPAAIDASAWELPARMSVGDREALVTVLSLSRSGSEAYLVFARDLDEEQVGRIDTIVQGSSRARQLRLYYGSLLRGDTLLTLAILGVVLLAASLYLSRRLAARIGGPLKELVDGTEIIAAGNLDHRVRVRALDELNDLVEAFNEMTSDLKRTKEERARAERIAAWEGIARRLAHEIKNPLTPIGLSMHRIRNKVDDPMVLDCVNTVLEETDNLERLANEFAQYARLPAPAIERVDLVKLLRGVTKLYASRGEIAVEWDGWPNEVWIDADAGLLRQAFSNLVKNAVEAMGGRGGLTLTHRDENGIIAVRVEDTGPGLSTGEDVFAPNFTTKESGTGLGLAIARKIIEDHGGSITAVGSAVGAAEATVGTGAVFRIELPRHADEQAGHHARPDEEPTR